MLFFLFLTSAHSLFLHGFSLAGDVRYAPRKLGAAWSGSRLFLHAAYVATSSESPWSLTAVSPIPHELQELLRMVGADDELLQSLGEIASLQKALPASFWLSNSINVCSRLPDLILAGMIWDGLYPFSVQMGAWAGGWVRLHQA